MTPYEEALARFGELYQRARESGLTEPSAVTLATATPDGRPSARTVLLKDWDEEGFVFYTNCDSRKGRELAANAHVALLFFWQTVFEQVQVEGVASPVSDAEADEYWSTRPRESQLGAWASRQSEPLESRALLLERVGDCDRRFDGAPVPRPPYWSGYRVVPGRIEFWKPGEHRLNERTQYVRAGDHWTVGLLNP